MMTRGESASRPLGWSVLILSILSCPHCDSESGTRSPLVPDGTVAVALYVDNGADDECIQATTNMFHWMGYAVLPVHARQINAYGLAEFDLLCIPGGNMYLYAQDLSPRGKTHIREFVSGGGGYVGICGGAYFAGERVIWLGAQLPMTPLGLYRGTAEGPDNGIFPFPAFGMCRVDIADTTHPIARSEPDSSWILYYWGPTLMPAPEESVTVLARYHAGNRPAILAFDYGLGRVFLVGPHPEFEEDSDRDGVDFPDHLDDRGSDWDLMKKAAAWCLRE